MKSTIKTLLLVMVIAIMGSCTHNNGDIGPLFGTWKLTEITKDGKVVEEYDGNIFYAFQSQVFCQRRVYEMGVDKMFASWNYEGDNMVIDYSDDNYKPYAVTGMNAGRNVLEVVKLTGSKMELRYTTPNGAVYGYKLEKWG